MSERRLEGKVALISGGAGGAGGAASRLFAVEGARVAILDIQQEAGRRTVEEIRAKEGDATFIEADVSDPDQVKRGVSAAIEQFGRIDVLMNHAGTVIVKPFLETTLEDYDRLMDINVKSMFMVTQAVLPGMLERGSGVIVNTSSISGVTASPLESLYCITKGAVLQLTRAIAVEYRDRGIRCNALCPGFIRTPHGLREIDELVAMGETTVSEDISASQGRMCEPEEVARAALFLAGDDSSFVNGSALFVDNAWTAAT
ncbi:MAG: SDR family oxidoreductase [Anaerolineales bacterium]|nr:SDR family oxidoreductase [Anaerolineales bacterium]